MTSANVLILLADRETAADVADWTERKDAKMQGGSDRWIRLFSITLNSKLAVSMKRQRARLKTTCTDGQGNILDIWVFWHWSMFFFLFQWLFMGVDKHFSYRSINTAKLSTECTISGFKAAKAKSVCDACCMMKSHVLNTDCCDQSSPPKGKKYEWEDGIDVCILS